MNAHSVVEDWETAPFGGGFEGLAELGDRGFDGAVEAADTWLFLRGGEPTAVVSDLQSDPRSGDIDAFEGASGRKHEAPNPAIVTLAAMLALGGEVRGRYYTDDTPLSAVHETLSEGGFTGYVELSENVLSGDYYYVYVDGEVDHVGFVGSSQRLYGEDAKDKAENEIGIYAVAAVSLPKLELPDPPTTDAGASSAPQSDPSDEPVDTSDSEQEDPADAPEPEPETDSEPESKPEPDSEPTAQEETGSAESESEDDPARASASNTEIADSATDSGADADSTAADSSDRSEPTATDPEPDPAGGFSEEDATRASETASTATASSERQRRDDEGSSVDDLATRTVPSLDPERSGHGASGKPGTDRDRSTSTTGERARSGGPATAAEAQSTVESRTGPEDPDGRSRETLETKIEEYEDRIEDLETTVRERETKIEELEAKLETVRNERDELQTRLDAMDAETDVSGGTELSPEEALEGTSLFVRDRERGAASLEDAHDGNVDREAVVENLRIEFHTTFDSTDVLVEGEPFETWLRSTPPYRFAEWLVTELLFEIRSTHAEDGLQPLYDELPAIDRVGFEETVDTAAATEDDAETNTKRFDIVARDKKGNPLVVADFDRRREPTRADTIRPFIADSSDVCEIEETLAAAVAVSSSFFESDAMAVTEEATSTSLLSRSKYRSYVKLTRSNGYHLCLVEARNDTFDLTVPELG